MKNISFMRNSKEFKPTRAELEQVLDDYAERLSLTEKAPELACEEFKNDCHIGDSLEEIIKHFKTKSKEMMKSE